MGRPFLHPIPVLEDNQATVQQIVKDRLTPNIKHADIPVCFLHEQYNTGLFDIQYVKTDLNFADLNTKPHTGLTFITKVLNLAGFDFYPPSDSDHFKLLELDRYNIGYHKSSFLRDK